MGIGDVHEVTLGECSDLHYVDDGMYDVAKYGSVYLLDAAEPAVVDTGIGTTVERVLDAMEAVGIAPEDLKHVLTTHVHLDHAGGAGFLVEACPNATVHTHEIGVGHLVDPDRLVAGTKAAVGDQWTYYTEPEPVPEDRIEPIQGGDEIDLGDRVLEVHHAPGHAPHQVLFHDRSTDALFTGDAAGIWSSEAGIVRQTSPPPNFDLEGCLEDVETIQAIDPDVLCFGHFGAREYDEGLMDEYADALSTWIETVRERRAELDDEAVIEELATESGMESVWGERKARAEERVNVRGALAYLDQEE